MPEAFLQVTNNKCVLARTANRAWGYGDDLVTDDSPGDQQIPIAWYQSGIGMQNLRALTDRQNTLRCLQMHYLRTPAITEEVYGGLICSWIETKNSFTLSDVLENDEDQLQALLYRFKTARPISSEFRDKLISRLNELLHDIKEDDMNQSINLGSFANFYNFVQQNNALKFPDISLTPDGDIFVSWLGDDDKEFNIQFLSDRDVLFALIVPNDRDPQRRIVISGEVTSDIIMDKVKPYNIMTWIIQ